MDRQVWYIWSTRALFMALALVILGLQLLPLGLSDTGLPPPDWLLAFTLAWLYRQPVVMSIGMIVVVFLLADFLLQRPPGLWTALVLLITEWLRQRRVTLTEVNFLIEWGSIAGAVLALLLLERFVLWILVAPQTSLGLSLMHGLLTVAVYPIAVAVSHYVFRVRKVALSDAETA
ncbi:MAG: rod shape-determining protein MreD [Pseudomonadota bacterium]